MSQNITIYIDGGSRGNPGPAAFGVVFVIATDFLCDRTKSQHQFSDEQGKVVKTYSQYLGKATNNEAEYQGLIFALKKTKALFGKEKIKIMDVEVRSDSELLIKQITGKYKILDQNIQKLFLQAWNLKIDFPKIDFKVIPREENKQADKLVNEALDIEAKSSRLL